MRTFKTLPFLLGIALLMPFLSSTGASAEAPAAFSFTGSGYGHGVGMSQIGAKARALSGESATAILNYYYKDVQVAPIVDTQTIRVNIGRALKTISFVSPTLDSMIQIFSGDIAGAQDVSPILTLGAKKKIAFSVDGAFAVSEGLRAKAFTIRWSGPATVILFHSQVAP